MSFNDIFKSSFLESITEFSLLDTLIGLVFALVVGLFIFLIYQKTLTGVMSVSYTHLRAARRERKNIRFERKEKSEFLK